jgi:hypothetical protein
MRHGITIQIAPLSITEKRGQCAFDFLLTLGVRFNIFKASSQANRVSNLFVVQNSYEKDPVLS